MECSASGGLITVSTLWGDGGIRKQLGDHQVTVKCKNNFTVQNVFKIIERHKFNPSKVLT